MRVSLLISDRLQKHKRNFFHFNLISLSLSISSQSMLEQGRIHLCNLEGDLEESYQSPKEGSVILHGGKRYARRIGGGGGVLGHFKIT